MLVEVTRNARFAEEGRARLGQRLDAAAAEQEEQLRAGLAAAKEDREAPHAFWGRGSFSLTSSQWR